MINNLVRKSIEVDKKNITPLWEIKQEDECIIKLSLYRQSKAFDITGQALRLGIKRKDKTLVEVSDSDSFIINGNELDIKLKNSISAIAGPLECDLELSDSTGKMTTASFFINVKDKVLNGQAIEGTNEFDTFSKTVAKVEEDYKGLRRIIIDENQAANLQDQVNKTNAQLEHIEQKVGNENNGLIKDVNALKNDILSVHTHENKSLLDNITSNQISEWNSKASTNYVDEAVLGITSGTSDKKGFLKNGSSNNSLNFNAKPIKPLISFTDDDGKIGVYTKWKSLLESKGIKISLCIPTGFVGSNGYMTWTQLRELQNDYGVEILSHTVSHKNISNHTNKTWIAELKESKEVLMSQGLKVRGFAYPNGGYWGTADGLTDGTSNSAWMSSLEYDYAIRTNGSKNTYPIPNNYLIDRGGIGSYDNAIGATLDDWKAIVDDVSLNGGWYIFMTHCDDVAHTDEDTANLGLLIDYIKEKGIDIVTIEEGFNIYGNIIETPQTIITRQGKIINDNLSSGGSSGDTSYATKTRYGIVKVGEGLSVNNGIISIDGNSYYDKSYLDQIINDFESRISSLENGGGGSETNNPPIVSSIANITAKPNASFTISYTATDSDGLSLHELSSDNGVNYNTISPVSSGNDFTYTTSIAEEGVYNYKLRVSDKLGATTVKSFNVTIENVVANYELTHIEEYGASYSDGIYTITNSAKSDNFIFYDGNNSLSVGVPYNLVIEVLEYPVDYKSIINVASNWDVAGSSTFGGLKNISSVGTYTYPFTLQKASTDKANRIIVIGLRGNTNYTSEIGQILKFKLRVTD